MIYLARLPTYLWCGCLERRDYWKEGPCMATAQECKAMRLYTVVQKCDLVFKSRRWFSTPCQQQDIIGYLNTCKKKLCDNQSRIHKSLVREHSNVEPFQSWAWMCENVVLKVVSWMPSAFTHRASRWVMNWCMQPPCKVSDLCTCGLKLNWRIQIKIEPFSSVMKLQSNFHSNCGKLNWHFGMVLVSLLRNR